MNMSLFIPVLLATLLNTIANTVWKIYFQKYGFHFSSFLSVLDLLNVYIVGGVICYVGSMLLFFYMLSRFDLSVIIPLTALTYIFNMLAAYFIFQESFDIYKISGMVVIILGIVILSISKSV